MDVDLDVEAVYVFVSPVRPSRPGPAFRPSGRAPAGRSADRHRLIRSWDPPGGRPLSTGPAGAPSPGAGGGNFSPTFDLIYCTTLPPPPPARALFAPIRTNQPAAHVQGPTPARASGRRARAAGAKVEPKRQIHLHLGPPEVGQRFIQSAAAAAAASAWADYSKIDRKQ